MFVEIQFLISDVKAFLGSLTYFTSTSTKWPSFVKYFLVFAFEKKRKYLIPYRAPRMKPDMAMNLFLEIIGLIFGIIKRTTKPNR